MSSTMTAKEIAQELDISLSKAYQIIRLLNNELKKKDYITLSGKVSRKYFNEKFYGGLEGKNIMN